MMLKGIVYSRKFAFTLAEVLIVLGIIGIIAEITVPALIENTQNQEWKSAAKEAYSKSSQAFLQMKADVGESFSYYIAGNAYTFEPKFMTYFRVAKDCGQQTCVPGAYASSIYKTLTGYGGDTADMGNDGQFVTADGMFYNIQQSAAANDPLVIVVDVNGYVKGPNVFGKDTYAFQVLNDNLVPMGTDNSYLPAKYYCQKSGNYAANYRQGLGCMAYVMQGINY